MPEPDTGRDDNLYSAEFVSFESIRACDGYRPHSHSILWIGEFIEDDGCSGEGDLWLSASERTDSTLGT
jgi:hypothetical protein